MPDPLAFNPDRVLANARQATTEDLLNRVTAYRAGMEPEALAIIEAELKRRGVRPDQIEGHAQQLQQAIIGDDGVAGIALGQGSAAGAAFLANSAAPRWRKAPKMPRA